MQPVCCTKALDPHDSDEEVFVLPDSNELDEEEDTHTIHDPLDHASAFGRSSSDERSTDLEAPAIQASTPIDGDFGESKMSWV